MDIALSRGKRRGKRGWYYWRRTSIGPNFILGFEADFQGTSISGGGSSFGLPEAKGALTNRLKTFYMFKAGS